MGVKGLWEVQETSGRPVSLGSLEGQVVAVDVSVWLHQALAGSRGRADCRAPHLATLLHRLVKLLFFRIRPVFVFDSKHTPALKRRTLEKRRMRRELATMELNKVQQRLIGKLAASQASVDEDELLGRLRSAAHDPRRPEDRLFSLSQDDLHLPIARNDDSDHHSDYSDGPDASFDDEFNVSASVSGEVDMDSAEFAALPVEAQREILVEAAEARKGIKSTGAHLPSNSQDFSAFQLQKLLHRGRVHAKLDSINRELTARDTSLSLEALRKDFGDSRGKLSVRKVVAGTRGNQLDVLLGPDEVHVELKRQRSQGPSLDDVARHFRQQKGLQELAGLKEEPAGDPAADDEDSDDPDLASAISLSLQQDDKTSVAEDHGFESSIPSQQAETSLVKDEDLALALAMSLEQDEKMPDVTETELEAAITASRAEFEDAQPGPSGLSTTAPREAGGKIADEKLVCDSWSSDSEAPDPPVERRKSSGLREPEISATKASNPSEAQTSSTSKPSTKLTDQTKTSSQSPAASSTIDQVSPDQADSESEMSLEDVEEPEPLPQALDRVKEPSTEGPPETKPSPERRREPVESVEELLAARRRAEAREAGLTEELQAEVQEALGLLGQPWLVAKGEAEAQCGWLESKGLVDATMTEDSDAFLFGAKKVLRYVFRRDRHAQAFRAADVHQSLGLTRERLILLGMLTGCDYTEGVEGVGVVAGLEVLAEFCEAEEGEGVAPLQRFRLWWDAAQKDPAQRPTLTRRRLARLPCVFPPSFPDHGVYKAFTDPVVEESEEKFGWQPPRLDAFLVFAHKKMGWTEAKVTEVLAPLADKWPGARGPRQTKMTSFAVDIPKADADMRCDLSKRAQAAVHLLNALRRGAKGDEDNGVLNPKDILKGVETRKTRSKAIRAAPAKKSPAQAKRKPAKNAAKKTPTPKKAPCDDVDLSEPSSDEN